MSAVRELCQKGTGPVCVDQSRRRACLAEIDGEYGELLLSHVMLGCVGRRI